MTNSAEPPVRRRRPRARAVLAVLTVLVLLCWAANSSRLHGPGEGRPTTLAHRGLGQTFDLAGIENDTCTAERIHPPEHAYLENTIAGMRAAFDAGADVVELDVHITRDDRFAVFHDWEVDCRTDGRGTTRDHTMAELRRLDIGYGYTADDGATHPFRGTGAGLMPSLDEVFAEFPDEELLIHVKSDDPAEGELLAEHLARLPGDRLAAVTVYGGDAPIAALRRELPGLRTMSKATLRDCLVRYAAVGWSGYVPAACAGTQLHVPEKIGPWLWGWPHLFVSRMAEAGTRVVLVGGSGDWSAGFDGPQDLERVPEGFTGTVWTNRADVVAPLVAERGR
ncbi:glycerophosphodiester phosphodiesterase family protein [Marinactinospora rubrisoli]|uniref:Glycerophosphodiester phosphodiesterase family protein n=1 Tax=Marinactinospora rubrisoli TaxID=2715399 RepID=A0ABW2KJS7_9ACTN